MKKKTPLQQVKERFGEKSSLVDNLVGKMERREGESKADAKTRLSKVSCAKLLNLNERFDEAQKYGGRSALIDAIHDFEARKVAKKDQFKEDAGYKKHLNKSSLGALLDRYKAVEKHQRQNQA